MKCRADRGVDSFVPGPDTDTSGEDVAMTEHDKVSARTKDVLRFLSFVTPYFNPSINGMWTFPLGAFLHYLAYIS